MYRRFRGTSSTRTSSVSQYVILIECLNNLLMQLNHVCFQKYVQNLTGGQFRASAHERFDPRRFFFTSAIKKFVLNGTKCTDGCFTTTFFQTQHASFSGRCGGRSAVGGGNGTKRTYQLAGTSGKTTARPPVFVCRSKQVHKSWI